MLVLPKKRPFDKNSFDPTVDPHRNFTNGCFGAKTTVLVLKRLVSTLKHLLCLFKRCRNEGPELNGRFPHETAVSHKKN